jgi:hypothetical protein
MLLKLHILYAQELVPPAAKPFSQTFAIYELI